MGVEFGVFLRVQAYGCVLPATSHEDHWRYDPRFTGSFEDDLEPRRDPYGDELDRRSVHSEHSGHSLRSSRSAHSRQSSFSSRSQQVREDWALSSPLLRDSTRHVT